MVNETLEKIVSEDPEFEKYVGLFSKRYKKEQPFREIIHRYLGLGKLDLLKLTFGNYFAPSWYRRKTEVMIRDYATDIRKKIIESKKLKDELEEVRKAEKELRRKEDERKLVEQRYTEQERKFLGANGQREAEKRKAEEELKQNVERENAKRDEERRRIEAETNAVEIARTQVKQYLAGSPLIKVNDRGEIGFNEEALTKKLEDLFLDDVLDEISRKDGNGGLFGKVRCDYIGLISYFDKMESLSELPMVDWIRSAIHSRTKGYRVPQFPHLITAKAEGKVKSKGSLDTAIVIDRSTSMRQHSRMDAARKTALATSALMRRLNPKNNSYLASYSDELSEISSRDLLDLRAEGNTSTDLALKWLIEKLKDKGPSLAYLVTDGVPWPESALKNSLKIAQEFKKYPIMLRVFLIDGEPKAREIIRDIGNAAGKNTKVICVDNYELAGGVIRNIGESIKGMMYASQL